MYDKHSTAISLTLMMEGPYLNLKILVSVTRLRGDESLGRCVQVLDMVDRGVRARPRASTAVEICVFESHHWHGRS